MKNIASRGSNLGGIQQALTLQRSGEWLTATDQAVTDTAIH